MLQSGKAAPSSNGNGGGGGKHAAGAFSPEQLVRRADFLAAFCWVWECNGWVPGLQACSKMTPVPGLPGGPLAPACLQTQGDHARSKSFLPAYEDLSCPPAGVP